MTRAKIDILKDMLVAKRLNYVGQRGHKNGRIVIVGEAPGADEERLGRPFVGASGKELGRMCKDADFKGAWIEIEPKVKIFEPSDLWYTNVFKVRPPDNKLPRLDEYGIPRELFIEVFLDEIRTAKPQIIIATGNTSLGTLCPQTRGKDDKARIGTYRGSLLTSKLLDWSHYVIPMYHPAYILRNWDERPVGVFCLERAREEYDYLVQNGGLRPLPSRRLRISPTFDDLYGYLKRCLEPNPRRVSIDIELLGGSWPYTTAIAISPYDAISFSFWEYEDWQLVKIWRLYAEILRRCPQIGQNYIGFDTVWHEWLGFKPNLKLMEDTMINHHVLWPEFPHKLQFLCMQYTREPYYKDEGRKWTPKQGLKPLMHYNAMDACVTFEAWERMQEEMKQRCQP